MPSRFDIMRKAYTVQKTNIVCDGQELEIIILKPTKSAKPVKKTCGILWIHGGGYAVGMAEMIYMSRAIDLVKKYGAVVVTPQYRLAGKAPYPAALCDCYAALKFLKENALSLGVNDSKLMIGGESAGGGLTLALSMYALDKGDINIAFQMPLYPMIDNLDTDSSRNNHGISWNTKRNHAAWKLYLRNVPDENIPAYAVPARREDLSGLPPAYTFVGDKEPFYCETIDFIERLKKAGVEASVDVYRTGFHAFDMLLPFRKISRQAIKEFEKQYLYAAENYSAPQKR